MNGRKTPKAGLLKCLLALPLSIGLIGIGNAQEVQPEVSQTQAVHEPLEDDNVVLTVVEKMPVFPGGQQALFEYLSKSIRYPAEAMAANEQGRVIVEFWVMKDGSIENIKVVRSISPALDKEAIRVVADMPRWTPGELRGEKVNVKYALPINFRSDNVNLQNNKETSDIASEGSSTPPTDAANKSISAQSPLFIVDGVVQSDNFDVNSLFPQQIEKVEVMKEKTGIKLYGKRAQNGVITITTRREASR